jgi:NitT/TauT family transport system permease protein
VILAPIFLVWFGYGFFGKLLLAAIVTFFPLLIALVQGVSAITKAERDLFRIYRASRWQTITRLMVPRSVPFIMAGLRVDAPMAVLGSLVAETAGARQGLGITMMIASANFNSSLLFAAALLSASIGLLAFALVVGAERLAIKYMEQ